ncbi:MAG: hypothetical protein NC191_00105 [Muribaculaceae bacterium]|nr:hypothetical protein [Muribaculaceae bacterium]
MNISAINSTTPVFSGKYKVNANQNMPSGEACIDRDLMLGMWLNQVNNYEQISTKFDKFFSGVYNENKTAPCNVIYDIPDSEDAHFEKCMNNCGQKFEKIA